MAWTTKQKLAVAGVGVGALVALSYWQRKRIGKVGAMVFDAAKRAAFHAYLAANPHTGHDATVYSDDIIDAASEFQISPFLIIAVGQRESRWGGALKQGTGDWTARAGHWVGKPHTITVPDAEALKAYEGWSPPKDGDGNIIPGPYAIPEDKLGWGRGDMQIDFDRAMTFNWADVRENIRMGARILVEKQRALAGKIPAGDELLRATVAAYNTGEGNVAKSYAAGGITAVDRTTTGKNYSADVLALANSLQSNFKTA